MAHIIADGPLPIAGHAYGEVLTLETATTHEPVADVSVEMWVRQVGDASYSKADVRQTAADGGAGPGAVLTKSAYVYWAFSGNATYGATQTDPMYVPVSTAGTIKVNDKTLRVGQRLVVRGTTYPVKPGRRVVLYLGTIPYPGTASLTKPKILARAYVRTDGTYRIKKRFHHKGKKKLYVQLPGGGGNVPGYTRYRRIRVG